MQVRGKTWAKTDHEKKMIPIHLAVIPFLENAMVMLPFLDY
jgi:hypothetical protein